MSELSHTRWPFFDDRHRDFAARLGAWADAGLATFESDDGNDGVAARRIFELLGNDAWLREALLDARSRAGNGADLRGTCLLRETLAYRSAIADVAFSEPWLGILPIALFGSPSRVLPPHTVGTLRFDDCVVEASSLIGAPATASRSR